MIVLAVVTDAASFMCKYRERKRLDVTRLPPQQHFQPGDSQRWRAVEAVGDEVALRLEAVMCRNCCSSKSYSSFSNRPR